MKFHLKNPLLPSWLIFAGLVHSSAFADNLLVGTVSGAYQAQYASSYNYWLNDTGDLTNLGSITSIPSGPNTTSALGLWSSTQTAYSLRNESIISSYGNAGVNVDTDIGNIVNIQGATIESTNGASSAINVGVWPLTTVPATKTVVLIDNAGTISGDSGSAIAIGASYAGYVGAISNSGSITSGSGSAVYIGSGSKVDSIENSGGAITGGTYAIDNRGLISSIVNTGNGTISGTDTAIYNNGGSSSAAVETISTITNNANSTIAGTNVGIYNTYATIGTITNFGNISGSQAGIWNYNSGTITRLNNAQSGLTYVGTLPTFYNVIITSSGYGSLNGTGQSTGLTTFGVSSLSTLRAGVFQNVLTGGIGRGNLANSTASTGTITGTLSGYRWTLTDDGSNWDLELVSLAPIVPPGPNAANTLSTVQQSAAGLTTTYNVQAAALQAGLTYDCNTFDKYGLCASVGGRTSYALTAPVGNQQAGLLVVSHRPDDHFRYGAFADQSVNSSMPNGIKQNNSGPMYGVFGYWNHQKDGMGLGASLTTAFSNSNLTVTRNNSLASTEAGSGNTEMSGQAIQAQGTYAVQATDRIKAIPYAGLRYYRVATGGYSEGANANVTSPLTYNGMSQEVFAAVGGVGTSVFLAEKLTGTASVGIQQNLNYKMGNYQGTSAISGLESFSVNMPSNINSMATATAGMSYAVKKNEKLGVNVLWQQQAFSATNTITALATYSIGF